MVISAVVQALLLAEPIWRAIKIGEIPSIIGTLLVVSITALFVLLGTIYQKTWARDLLAVLAIGGFGWALVSGDLFAIEQQSDRFLPAATSIPNLIAVALLYTPLVDAWFKSNTPSKPV